MLLIPSSFIIFFCLQVLCEAYQVLSDPLWRDDYHWDGKNYRSRYTFLCLPLWKYCELSHAHITASFVSCYYYIEEQLGFYYQNNIWISIPFPLLLGQFLNFNSIPSNILFSLIFFPSLAVSLYMSVTKFSDTSFIDINFDQYQHFRCFHTWFLCHFPC